MRFAAFFLILITFYCNCKAQDEVFQSVMDAIHYCTVNVGHEDNPLYNCRGYERNYVGHDRIEYGKNYCIKQNDTPEATLYSCAESVNEANYSARSHRPDSDTEEDSAAESDFGSSPDSD
ncbi:uncharacterized protein LOC122503530 [Leptopilina heterotoma]|uniref:uncharacterized protein LOC122503530 n=1 Tax=Leptopilina heterotoma TaxID=63436 RepID=UPI001CA95127|nr:uncharacterized protein LOC122503530 [Leptopilina heterotoma]